jgi:glycosyltransferase involved in cell wall biosynthesis
MEIDNSHVLLVGLGLHKSTGGTSKSVGYFSEALNSGIISFADENKYKEEGFSNPNTIPALHPHYGFRYFFGWPRKDKMLQANMFANCADIFSCHTLYRYHVSWVIKHLKIRNRPYWVVPHGCLDPYTYNTRKWMKELWMFFVGRSFLKNASFIVFSTHREYEKAKHWCRPEQARIIYWPTTSPTINSSFVKSAHNWRKRLDIPSGHRILLFLGRLHEMKRPLETIEAFSKIRLLDLHLIIAGPEETLTIQDCKSMATELCAINVHVIGPVYGNDKDSLLDDVDGFISLSHRENFGHAVAEALSHKLPLIITPGIDLSYEIKDENCAWILPYFSIDNAVSCINEFNNSSREGLAIMGENGSKWVINNLSFDSFKKSLVKLTQDTRQNFLNNFPVASSKRSY